MNDKIRVLTRSSIRRSDRPIIFRKGSKQILSHFWTLSLVRLLIPSTPGNFLLNSKMVFSVVIGAIAIIFHPSFCHFSPSSTKYCRILAEPVCISLALHPCVWSNLLDTVLLLSRRFCRFHIHRRNGSLLLLRLSLVTLQCQLLFLSSWPSSLPYHPGSGIQSPY